MEQLAPDDLLVEIDGAGITPVTVDARRLLGLASAYIALLEKVADDEESDLVFTGLGVVPKCAALSTKVRDPSEAWRLVSVSNRYLSGDSIPPGAKGAVADVKAEIQRLGEGQTAGVRVGEKKTKLSLVPADVTLRPWATTSLWVRPIRVGGKRDRAVLESDSESGTFAVDLTLEKARELGRFLKMDVLADLLVSRNTEGRIDGGQLIDFSPPDVDPKDAMAAWQKWFSESVDAEATLRHLRSGEDD